MMIDWQWPPLPWLLRRTGIAMVIFSLFATAAILAPHEERHADLEMRIEWVANAGDGCAVWRTGRQRDDGQWVWVYWRRCNGDTM